MCGKEQKHTQFRQWQEYKQVRGIKINLAILSAMSKYKGILWKLQSVAQFKGGLTTNTWFCEFWRTLIRALKSDTPVSFMHISCWCDSCVTWEEYQESQSGEELSLIQLQFQLHNRPQMCRCSTGQNKGLACKSSEINRMSATSCPDRVLESLCLGHSAFCYQAACTGDTGHGPHLIGWPPFPTNYITPPAGSRRSRLFDWRIPAPQWAWLLLLLSNSQAWHPHCSANSVPILKPKFYL